MVTPTPSYVCGAFQTDPPPRMRPYRCSEPPDHDGHHRAAIDGEVVAEWPRPIDVETWRKPW